MGAPLHVPAGRLQQGAHACSCVDGAEEWTGELAAFVAEGRALGETVLVVCDPPAREALVAVPGCVETGEGAAGGDETLRFRDARGILPPGSDAEPQRLLDLLKSEVEAATAAGRAGLRAALDMGSLVGGATPVHLARLEQALEAFLPGRPCSILCVYDSRCVEPRLLLYALALHPLIFAQAEVWLNPYQVDSPTLPPPQLYRAVVGACLRNLSLARRTIAAQRGRDASLQRLFEATGDVLLSLSPDGRIVAIQGELETFTGFKSSECLGRDCSELAVPEDGPRVRELLRGALEGLEVPRFRVHLRTRSGNSIAGECVLATRRERGEIAGVACRIRDARLEEQREDDLRGRERTYRTLAQNLPAIVYRLTLGATPSMHFFNDSLETVTGYREEELSMGEVCLLDPLMFPPERGEVIETVRQAVARVRPFSLRYSVRHKDGSVRCLLERGTPVWEGGAPAFVDGVIFDITDIARFEASLEAHERRQEALERMAVAALAAGELPALMEAAARAVSAGLQVERARVLELLPGGKSCRVAAVEGWNSAGVAKGQVLPLKPGGWVDRALRSDARCTACGAPAIDEGDSEVPAHPELPAPGVAAGLCAVVPGEEEPWGLLEAYSNEPRDFAPADMKFMIAAAGLLGVAIEWERAERLLRESAERLQAQYNGIPIPTYTWRWNGSDFILEEYNEAARSLTDGQIEGWRGTTLAKMYGDMPDVQECFRRCLAEKTVIRREMDYRFRDSGRHGFFSLAFAYVPPDTVMVHAQDITARRANEEALRWQAQVMEQIHEAVVTTDLDGVVTTWNKGAERLLGYSAEEALGRHVSFLYNEEQREFLEQGIIAPLKARGTHQVDVKMRNRSGRQFDGRLFLSLLRDAEGTDVGMVGYTIDESERVEATRALTATARRLEVLNAVGRSISESRSPQVIAEVALRGLSRLVPFSGADIILLDRSGRRARLLAGYREGALLELRGTPVPLEALGDIDRLRQGEPERVQDLEAVAGRLGPARRSSLEARSVRSFLRVPLLARDKLVGLLSVGSDRPGAFTDEHVEAAREVASLAAIGIRQAGLIATLRSRRGQLKRLGRELATGREIERRQLSRTLHEETAQMMSAQKMSLELMAADTPESLAPLKARLEGAIRGVESLLGRTRLLAYWLRPPALDVLGLDASLEGVCREFAAGSGLSVSYAGQRLRSVPEPIAVTLYRLLQEALTDARRRGAESAEVQLGRKKGVLRLTVADDGEVILPPGGPADGRAPALPVGLAEMRDLLRLFDGDMRVVAREPRGLHLEASVPHAGSSRRRGGAPGGSTRTSGKGREPQLPEGGRKAPPPQEGTGTAPLETGPGAAAPDPGSS